MASQITYKLQVNKEARLLRHRRLYERYSTLSYTLRKAGDFIGGINNRLLGLLPRYRKFSPLIHFHWQGEKVNTSLVTPRSIQQRIAALSVALFVVTGFMVNGIDVSAEESTIPTENLTYIVDQEGYFTKANPQTFEGQRIVKDKITHVVESGENISTIASNYGLKTETLLWENGLNLGSTLQIGQKLIVPPVDGVTYAVQSGESLEKIAQKYKIEKTSIIAYNDISNSTVSKGQVIFLPSAKPLAAPDIASRPAFRDAAGRSGTASRLSNTDTKPSVGKFLIFPTIGKLTQGFKRGHFAYDIANVSKPPIWAAAGGKVIKASSGTYGGGYGNHVIIDHGNGVQTLYAHMEYLTVKVGDQIAQGQVIGKMGRTGRVYGVTGIHLHFEVVDRGVKKVPGNYY